MRNASFVPLESQENDKFKYYHALKIKKYLNDRLIVLQTILNKIIQKPALWTRNVDFRKVRNDTALWSLEALIEGVLINFAVWALLGWKFNLITVMAWGIAIKQLLSVYWRLKKDGTPTTIPTKD